MSVDIERPELAVQQSTWRLTGFWTIVRREFGRIIRIWGQTIGPPRP